jgi:arabinogalactan oligomer/maltooligosaccharide transport system permease protein
MIEQRGTEVQGVASPAIAVSAVAARRAFALPWRRARPKLRPDEAAFLWISRVIIWAFTALILVPLVLVVFASLNTGSAFLTGDILPTTFTLDNYKAVLDPNQSDFIYWIRNSAIICGCTSALAVLLVSTTGYAFSRFRFHGKKYGLMALLLIQMFPAQMAFVALYFLLLKVHMFNTYQGLILVFLGGGIPFNAWLFKGYVDGLPRDLEESAYVDGATKFQAFWKIILPLTRPMMAVIFIFQFIGIYNDYILINFLTQSQLGPGTHYTVAVGLYQYLNTGFEQNWTQFSAGAILAAIPIVLVFLAAQKWLVSGLAAGAVKG